MAAIFVPVTMSCISKCRFTSQNVAIQGEKLSRIITNHQPWPPLYTVMSFFIGNSSQYSQANVDPEKIKLAEVQFNATAATFNKVLLTCAAKCVNHEYGETDLLTGEGCCVDRCVTKYMKANVLVGTNFQDKKLEPYNAMPEYKKVTQMLEKANK